MKLSNLTRRKWFYTALAFLLPLVFHLLFRLVKSLLFDGEFSMLYSDMYHQYYPFFLDFRRTLRSGDSLLYTWSTGLGMDYLGLISYYLASPLNLISALLPESWMLGYFGFLTSLKLGFAGLFFAIFLKNVFKKNDCSIVVFGGFYAMCAWALGYQWNIMWLDTFALLPLVVLGMYRLLTQRRFILYTFSLFLSIAANYYIGLFTCLFVFLAFFCFQICRWQGFRKFILDLLWIALLSALAIGMTAFLELPTLAALQTTQSSVNKFPTGFRLNIADKHTLLGLFDAMRQVASNMSGCLTPTLKEGLPNLYCGISTNILAFLFLTCKQVKLRDKVCTIMLLLFFNVSFIIRQLDYIWHGFHFTNMIPYRFSFLYSFVMLYMAYQAWVLRKHFRLWQILAAGVLALGLVLCSEELNPFLELITGKTVLLPWKTQGNISANLDKIFSHSTMFVVYNGLFLLLYLFMFIYSRRIKPPKTVRTREDKGEWLSLQRSKRALSSTVLLGIMVLELVLNIANFGLCYNGTNVSNYPKGTTDTADVISHMKELEADTLFYRAEMTHTQTLNDGALNDYNGITAFTSSANVKTTEFMKAFGYGAKNTYNRYSYEESSPIANLFLDLKYMIERDGSVKENAYFDDVYSSGQVTLLKNNAHLPLGFLANSQLINVDFGTTGNRFIFQNDLMKAATGLSEDLWYLQLGNSLTINGSDLTLHAQNETGYCSFETESSNGGKITYRYTADKAGLMCFHVDQSKKNKFSVYINDSEKPIYSETYSLPQMLSACNVVPGDVVEIRFTCSANQSGTISVSAAVLDEPAFRRAYDVLNASTLKLTSFESTRVEGTINCDRSGVLYTSIPQNGNWSATVDGTPAQIVLIGNVMVGVLLSEGEHSVCFNYHNKAFSLGWKTSLICLALFLMIIAVRYYPKLKPTKGKFAR